MKDSLIDLTPYMQKHAVNAGDYIDSVIDALTIDGKVYALPTSINTSLLYYNRALFDKAADELRAAFGLSPPMMLPKAETGRTMIFRLASLSGLRSTIKTNGFTPN